MGQGGSQGFLAGAAPDGNSNEGVQKGWPGDLKMKFLPPVPLWMTDQVRPEAVNARLEGRLLPLHASC